MTRDTLWEGKGGSHFSLYFNKIPDKSNLRFICLPVALGDAAHHGGEGTAAGAGSRSPTRHPESGTREQ